MGIGTSMGAYYEDAHHKAAAEWNPGKYDDNIVDPEPDKKAWGESPSPLTKDMNNLNPENMMIQKNQGSDPNIVYDDSGNMVDYSTDKLPEYPLMKPMKSDDLPLLEQQGMKNDMPFPDNRNPDTDFNSRFGKLPPSGILNDIKKPTGETVPLLRKISDIQTASPLVTITDQDIDKAISLGLSFSGGGLKIEKVSKAALRNDAGEIFEGQTHGHAFEKYVEKYPEETHFGNVDQGFTTNKGRFVSREEAFQIAKDQNQFTDKGIPPVKAFGLLSEDLSQ